MFKLITKAEYWNALDDKKVYSALKGGTRALDGLKHIQDYWMLEQLMSLKDQKICEIGGANSRVLPPLSRNNEVWNIDRFEGAGNGPSTIEKIDNAKYVFANLGEFSKELPDGYFDIVFSISVIEHISIENLFFFWADHYRILKNGGRGLHLIDLYIKDNPNAYLEEKINQYIQQPMNAGMHFYEQPSLKRPIVFTSDIASNSDWGMWRWNKNSPKLQKTREISQSVSLSVILTK